MNHVWKSEFFHSGCRLGMTVHPSSPHRAPSGTVSRPPPRCAAMPLAPLPLRTVELGAQRTSSPQRPRGRAVLHAPVVAIPLPPLPSCLQQTVRLEAGPAVPPPCSTEKKFRVAVLMILRFILFFFSKELKKVKNIHSCRGDPFHYYRCLLRQSCLLRGSNSSHLGLNAEEVQK